MKNKNLIIGIIVAVVVAIVVAAAIIFTNNNNKQTSSTNGESKASESNVAQGKEIDNNENYFVIINGEKFKAGDKFSKLSKVNLKQDSRVTSKEVVFCKERFVRVYIKPSNDLPDEEIKIT